jgi:hypothetical protein
VFALASGFLIDWIAAIKGSTNFEIIFIKIRMNQLQVTQTTPSHSGALIYC